jgi:hypothetical protein
LVHAHRSPQRHSRGPSDRRLPTVYSGLGGSGATVKSQSEEIIRVRHSAGRLVRPSSAVPGWSHQIKSIIGLVGDGALTEDSDKTRGGDASAISVSAVSSPSKRRMPENDRSGHCPPKYVMETVNAKNDINGKFVVSKSVGSWKRRFEQRPNSVIVFKGDGSTGRGRKMLVHKTVRRTSNERCRYPIREFCMEWAICGNISEIFRVSTFLSQWTADYPGWRHENPSKCWTVLHSLSFLRIENRSLHNFC